MIAPAPDRADRAFGIVPGNQLIGFDTASPGTLTQRAITGLGVNESVRGIDARISNGQLYICTVTTGSAANSVIRTYTVNPDTGAASLVGQTAAALAGGADVPTGWDVRPRGTSTFPTQTDRARYVNTNDENARINTDSGALASNDTDLTPAATTELIGAAHDTNTTGNTNTLYAIDRNSSSLARQGGPDGTPSADAGVVTDLAPLGFTLNAYNDGGLDISPSGSLYAALTAAADNLTRLYAFSKAGEAVSLGLIGNGALEVRSLTILPLPDSPAAPPAPPPPASPAPDRASPVVLVALLTPSQRLTHLLRGFAYELSCNEACTATGSLVVNAPATKSRRITIASGSATLAAAGKARLRVKATRSGRRVIRRLRRGKRRLRATLGTAVRDAAGNRTTVTKRLTLFR